MSVVSQIEEIGPCRKKVSIEVPQAAVEAEVLRVVETFRKHAKAPGFRQGKMPVPLVQQRYADEIEKEVLERLVPRYWNQARSEKDLDPLLAPEVESVEYEPDSLSFVATVDVRPEIEVGDIGNFDLPESNVDPSDEEIDQAMEELRESAGSWTDVDRAAAEGDMIEAEITELSAEEPEPQKVVLEIGDEQVWEELSTVAVGLSAGEEAEFERVLGEGDATETKRFLLKATTVRERELPELEEVIAKVGEFKSVEELRERVVEELVARKNAEHQRDVETAVLDQLRDRHHFPLPQAVVDMEIEGLLQEYAQGLASRGVDVEKAEIDWQELGEQVRPQATKRVEARLLLDAIAESAEIEVSSEELESTLASLAQSQQTTTVALRQAMAENGQLERLTMQLRRQKMLRRLLGQEESLLPESDRAADEEE